MNYKLIDIGRDKFNGVVSATSYAQLLKHVKKHLMSRLVEIDSETGKVYAGDRCVGRVEEIRPDGAALGKAGAQ